MADINKDILILPNTGEITEPIIVFTGEANDPITLRVLDDNTISYEGSAGQLFSISPSLTGNIFSVNDISGVPSIEVYDTGEVRIAEFAGNVGIGMASPAYKLDINGVARATSFIGNIAGNATSATTTTHISGGAAGSLPYQSGTGATTFLTKGSNGQVLKLVSGVPAWGTDNNTTYSVGNGLTSSGTVFSLGTPTGLTAGTTNALSTTSHTHSIATDTAVGLSNESTNSAGGSASLARADHTHAITGFSLETHNHDTTYQPLDADLSDIAGLTGTTGILRKTAANTWTLDTTGYTTNTGTVTSVAMTVPTGLSVSGSPITTSGTLALSFTSGYSIPTTAKQGQWDSAYTDTSGATNASTASKIVKRDASGNFSAGTITASLSGNATSANKVNNALTLKFDTGTSEGTSLYTFDGSSAKTINIKGGTNVSIAKASGEITISATDTKYTSASFTHSGLTGTHNLTDDLKPIWGNITSKPTTVSGYGITDAMTTAHPANSFTSGEVTNLRAGKLDDGTTPWTNAANITSGTISSERLPAIAITSTYVKGTEAEHLALSSTTQEGDVVVRTDLKKNFIKNSGTTGTMADWTLLETPDDVVTSVNGKAGVIVLVPSDIGAEASFSKNTAFNKNFETSTSNIKMNGTVSVGSSSTIARADHIHPVDTSRQATITGAATTIAGSNLTASRALISNSSGKVAVSSTTDTELGYLSGVTSSIQTQLNGKQATHTHPYLSNTTSSTQSGYFGDIYLKDDTNASHYLKITNANDLTAERTLSIVTGDADRTLDLTYSRATSGLTSATVFSDIIVLNGAITGLSTRNLTPSNIGAEASFTKNTAFNKNFETTATNIKMNGTQSVGSSSTIARADHIHPVDTSRAASSHSHGSITNDGKIGSTANLLAVTGTGGVLGTLTTGTSGQVLKLNSSLVPTWSTEYSYTHPTAGAGSIATALTGASVISKLVVNSDGHVTGTATRNLTLGDLGYSGDANANNYTLPVATDLLLGGVKTGYTVSGKNYPVQLDASSKMYVNVPWVDTNTWRGIDTSPVSGENSDSISSGWAFTHNAATGNGAHVPAAGGAGTFLAGNGAFSTPPYPVTSVNTKNGAVVLTHTDVGASPSGHTHSTTVTHNATTLTLATGGTSDTVNGATATTAGVVTNGAQTWAGVKTFNSAPVSANGYTTGSATMVYNSTSKTIDFVFV